jgi:hypothetical protein
MIQEHLSHYVSLIDTLSLDGSEDDTSDLSVLTYMAHMVAVVALEVNAQPEPLYPFFTYRKESFHAFHRIIVYRPSLPPGQDIPFVGFISRRQAQVSAELVKKLDEVDKILVPELAAQGDLLTYSSLQLHDGNWFNLVQFAQSSAKDNLLATKTHQHAAYELAPQYYQWIRLHHGLILQGNLEHGLHLHRTKYYTFQLPVLRPTIRVHEYLTTLAR